MMMDKIDVQAMKREAADAVSGLGCDELQRTYRKHYLQALDAQLELMDVVDLDVIESPFPASVIAEIDRVVAVQHDGVKGRSDLVMASKSHWHLEAYRRLLRHHTFTRAAKDRIVTLWGEAEVPDFVPHIVPEKTATFAVEAHTCIGDVLSTSNVTALYETVAAKTGRGTSTVAKWLGTKNPLYNAPDGQTCKLTAMKKSIKLIYSRLSPKRRE